MLAEILSPATSHDDGSRTRSQIRPARNSLPHVPTLANCIERHNKGAVEPL